jgi:hypothetical protein
MFVFSPKITNIAFLIAVATVLSIDLEPAKALVLNGSLGISGNGSIDEAFDGISFGTVGDKTKLSFLSPLSVVSVSGDFAVPAISPALLGSSSVIKDLILKDTDADLQYDNPKVKNFINFGSYTINTVTSNLYFDLKAGSDQFIRNQVGNNISYQDPNGILGTFKFNGKSFGQGFLNISQSRQTGSFQISLEAIGKDDIVVPEPSAMLGIGIVTGLIALKKNGKKDSASNKA